MQEVLIGSTIPILFRPENPQKYHDAADVTDAIPHVTNSSCWVAMLAWVMLFSLLLSLFIVGLCPVVVL